MTWFLSNKLCENLRSLHIIVDWEYGREIQIRQAPALRDVRGDIHYTR